MKYDLVIIGSGPAGYVAAIKAGQVGLKTAIIEKEHVGGMCLNWGCIPSKALLESAKLYQRIKKDSSRFGIDGVDKKAIKFNYSKAVKRANTSVTKLTKGVAFLLKKNGVDLIEGEAKIISNNSITVENRNIEAENIIIATGSHSPKIDEAGTDVITGIKELFTDIEIPENIVVLGNTAVAVELAQLYNMIDKNVTLIYNEDSIMPLADEYVSNFMLNILKKNKINIIDNFGIDSLKDIYKDGELDIDGKKVKCDMLINARERKAIIPESDIELETENGFIKTDEDCKTSYDNVYAIGDVNGKSYFAHIGSAQGLHVIDKIKGVNSKLDIKKYPLNMYTTPEIAQIGLTEKEIKEQGYDIKIGEFPLSANGKALTEGNTEGFVRVLSEKKYGEVLGVQIVAANATDLIAEASAYMQLESTVYDIAKTVHAHPTVSEVFMEAGMDAAFKAIHK
jgi:dihydrolipoamide dehydrogenase